MNTNIRSSRSVLVLAAAWFALPVGACSAPVDDFAAGDVPSSAESFAGLDTADASAVVPFELTSSALSEGATFAVENACTGVNTSPPFAWTTGPAGTKSYAMVMTDRSIGLVHWVIFDVPSSATSLPANIEKAYQPANVAGAKQTTSYSATSRGYLGPCPPVEHTYEFALHALDVATLPGGNLNTTRAEAITMISRHELGVAKLTGTYAPP